MARFRTFDDLDVRNKTVLLRADLNVPVKALGAGRAPSTWHVPIDGERDGLSDARDRMPRPSRFTAHHSSKTHGP